MSGSPTCLAEDDCLQFQHPRLNSNSTAERRNHRYLEQQLRNQSPRMGEARPPSHATIHDQAEHESIHQNKTRIISKDLNSYSPSSSSFWTRDNFSQRRESIGNQWSDPRDKQYPIMPTEPNGGAHLPTPLEEMDRPKNHIGDLYPENNVQYPPPPDMSRHQDFAGGGPTAAQGRYQGQYDHRNCFEPPPITEDERFNRYHDDHVHIEHTQNCTHHENRSQNRTGGDCGHSGCNVELNHQGHSPSSQFPRHRRPQQPPVCQDCKSHRHSGQRHDMFLSHNNYRCFPNGEQEMRELLREMKESLETEMEAGRRANKEFIQQVMEKIKEKVEAENRAATIARVAEKGRIEEMVSLIQAMLEQRMKQNEAQQVVTQAYTEQGRPWYEPWNETWGGSGAETQSKPAGRREVGWPGATQPSQLFMHPSAQPFNTFGPRIGHQSIRNQYNDSRPFEEVLPVPPVAPQPPRAIFDAEGDNHIFESLSNKFSDSDKSSPLSDTQIWHDFRLKLQRQKAAYEALLINESPRSAYAKLDWSPFDASQGHEYERIYDEQSYHL